MPLTDLSLEACRAYEPALQVPHDLDEFWSKTLEEARAQRFDPTFEPIDNGLRTIRTYDVTFAGFAGHPVKAWLHLPADSGDASLPCVVQYVGYSGGRGLPHETTLWAQAGYAHFVMDTRGQGWARVVGDTADPEGSEPASPGMMTRGIRDRDTYYFRRVFTDAVRAVETARAHPTVDSERTVIAGGSQGGGITLATASLVPGLAGVMADVPYLCNFRRAVDICGRGPYLEIADYLKLRNGEADSVFDVLANFDAAVLVSRATAPALFSIAMMDDVCPPSTCFSAFNRYSGPKEVRVYEFNGHEGGGPQQQRQQLAWLSDLLK